MFKFEHCSDLKEKSKIRKPLKLGKPDMNVLEHPQNRENNVRMVKK
jgi:hypothetical protein